MKTMLFYCTHIFIVPAHIMLWHICVSSTQSTPLSPRHDPVLFQSVMYTSSSREIPLSGNVSKCECNAEDIVRESQISSRAGWSKEYEDFHGTGAKESNDSAAAKESACNEIEFVS